MAASGLLGGAQNIELTDHTLGGPKNGEAHLPVNILHLLRFEGRLDRLEDPLAGSHSIEALTERLAETDGLLFKTSKDEAVPPKYSVIHGLHRG